MTQITVRNVEEDLADKIRRSAAESGESMNALLLRLLRCHFLKGADRGIVVERNDLSRYRQGWVEDAECEAALKEFGKVDRDEWR